MAPFLVSLTVVLLDGILGTPLVVSLFSIVVCGFGISGWMSTGFLVGVQVVAVHWIGSVFFSHMSVWAHWTTRWWPYIGLCACFSHMSVWVHWATRWWPNTGRVAWFSHLSRIVFVVHWVGLDRGMMTAVLHDDCYGFCRVLRFFDCGRMTAVLHDDFCGFLCVLSGLGWLCTC